jgi:hypothetical protein
MVSLAPHRQRVLRAISLLPRGFEFDNRVDCCEECAQAVERAAA